MPQAAGLQRELIDGRSFSVVESRPRGGGALNPTQADVGLSAVGSMTRDTVNWQETLSKVRNEYAGKSVSINESAPPVPQAERCGVGYTEPRILDGRLCINSFIDPRITDDQKTVVLFHEAGHVDYLLQDEQATVAWLKDRLPPAASQQFCLDCEHAAFVRQASECLRLARDGRPSPLKIFVQCLEMVSPDRATPFGTAVNSFKKEAIWHECTEEARSVAPN